MNTSKKDQLFYNLARLILAVVVVVTGTSAQTVMAVLDVPVTAPITPPVTPPVTPPTGEELKILTASLPNGKVSKSYRSRIAGTSSLKGQNLVLSANGLPLGLKVKNCKTAGRFNTSVNCLITGYPQQMGTFTIELVLFNQTTGQVVNKFLLLTINSSGQ